MSDNPLADSLFRPQSASTRALEERKIKALESIAASLARMSLAFDDYERGDLNVHVTTTEDR